MPKLDLQTISRRRGSDYPPPFDRPVAQRVVQRLGDAGGLSQFGVNRIELPPGTWSSQRHWHSHEDEFVYVLEGTVVLITDRGEELLCAGDCAAFPHGVHDGHHLANRGTDTAVCLCVGTRSPVDVATYPDVDLVLDATTDAYTHRDGSRYPVA